jgi:hypothetical protein
MQSDNCRVISPVAMLNFPDSLNDLLTPQECAQIDQTLLPTRDRFSIRMTVYSWRYLQMMGRELKIDISALQPQHIQDWLRQDSHLQRFAELDVSFLDWFGALLIAALNPLQCIAQKEDIAPEQLTLAQIIAWFQHQVDEQL